MGGFLAQVGKYKASYGDYLWDYLKDKKPKEYYENYTFDITVKNKETGEFIDYEVPVLGNFIKIKKLRKNYKYEHIDKNNLFYWLFNKVIKEEKLYAHLYINTHWGQYPTKWMYFDVVSKIGDFPIKLESRKPCNEDSNNCNESCYCNYDSCICKQPFEIKLIKDVEWISNNGLNLEWCNYKGIIY